MILRWSFVNACLIIPAALISILLDNLTPLLLTGVSSFFVLTLLFRRRWTPQGGFGLANIVTALRLAGILYLGFAYPGLNDTVIAVAGVFLLLADGVDGWLAKRYGQASEFGECFDKETDAFFILILTLLLLFKEIFGGWILIIGLLRYGSFLTLYFFRTKTSGERKSPLARVIAVVITGILLFCFLPVPYVREPIAILGTLLLIYSFSGDFIEVFAGGRLTGLPVEKTSDIKEFFNRQAADFSEQHGKPDKLLEYRIGLIKRKARFHAGSTLLDIGCGTGHHLIALSEGIREGTGIDFSDGMISAANAAVEGTDLQGRISFRVDDAQTLATVRESSVENAICIGAIEHMIDKQSVANNVFRVLTKGGRFVCLTPNGGFFWYRKLAPFLNLNTRHLSSDRFLTASEFDFILRNAGFTDIEVDFWTFIPKGDMHFAVGQLLSVIDWTGRMINLDGMRGGLLITARKV